MSDGRRRVVDPAEGVDAIGDATLRAVHRLEVAAEWIERAFLPGFESVASAPAPELAVAAAALAELLGLATPARAPHESNGAGAPAASDPFVTLGAWRLPGLG